MRERKQKTEQNREKKLLGHIFVPATSWRMTHQKLHGSVIAYEEHRLLESRTIERFLPGLDVRAA
jgi:hypothetical protein